MTKSEQAITLLKEMIASGDLRPGARLPREADLSQQLGISRNALREAVRALESMQILEARQGDGTYVSSLDSPSLMAAMTFAVEIAQPDTMLEFLEIRRLLEVHCVEMAAARRTPDQLDKLDDILLRAGSASDLDVMIGLDMEFHEAVAECCANATLASFLKVISSQTLRARIGRGRHADSDFTVMRSEHQSVVVAIRERDVGAARSAMWMHISGVMSWLRRSQAESP